MHKTIGMLFCLILIGAAGLGLFCADAAMSRSKQELCENNQRRIAELKKTSLELEELLAFTSASEEFSRSRLSDFNKALADPRIRDSIIERHLGQTAPEQAATLRSLGAEWKLQYGYSDLLLLRAARAAQIRRLQRITYALSHHAELKQQQANVGKQLDYHLNRLAELGCEDPRETPKSGCEGFAGTWQTSFGQMTFTISGNEAESSYDFDGGTLRGELLEDGRVLSGTYSEREAKGAFRFELSADGQSFTGNWRRTSGKREPPSGTWEGKCVQQ